MGERLDLALRILRALPELPALRPDSRRTLADAVEARVRAHPERPFLLYGETGAPRVTTWGELDARANRVAAWALAHGLRCGDVAALLMENRPEYVSTWLGLAKVGVTTALLNSHLSGPPLLHALEASGARTLVCGTECLDRYAEAARPADLDVWLVHEPTGAAVPTAVPSGCRDLDADLASRPDRAPDPSVREDLRAGHDLFYIYTSGTTGLPKAARFSHARFTAVARTAAVLLRLEPGDVHYCTLPLYHSAGGAMMVGGVFASGATLALRRRFSARAFWDDCRRFGATRFQYIGELCRYLLNQPPRPDDRDHGVRRILGNGLRPEIWEAFQSRFGIERIVEFYAATEGNATLVNVAGKVGSVGRPPLGPLGRRNIRLVRFDPEREEPARNGEGFCIECQPDEAGELIGRIADNTPIRFEGYTSKQATEAKVLRDVFQRGDAWFRTGDLLRCDREGWYRFVDRIGDTFRWKGENVSTQEVEEVLAGFPGVELVNVYGVEIPGADGRAGMAALVLAGGANGFDGAAFHAFVDQRLTRYAAPVFVRLVDRVEVTGTLKLRKVELRQEAFDLSRVADPIFLRDDDARAYVPLTQRLRGALLSGQHRL
jgi:fatty-acyl-CoA synthase